MGTAPVEPAGFALQARGVGRWRGKANTATTSDQRCRRAVDDLRAPALPAAKIPALGRCKSIPVHSSSWHHTGYLGGCAPPIVIRVCVLDGVSSQQSADCARLPIACGRFRRGVDAIRRDAGIKPRSKHRAHRFVLRWNRTGNAESSNQGIRLLNSQLDGQDLRASVRAVSLKRVTSGQTA
jgi:hypothetical protein